MSAPRSCPLYPLAKPASMAPVSAFGRGVAAWRQYGACTGSVKIPRDRVERLEDGTEVRFGGLLSNTKRGAAYADRAKGAPARRKSHPPARGCDFAAAVTGLVSSHG
ncbi:hypothetical protein GCM10009574_071190 [Streptomyces asiaticus]|uniref:SpoVT-AbrB domain-containing protein n=2 Tax=Streptomyces rhizosphaericus TaxID=114699 RepID=A0ABP4AZG8_9ACTN